MTAKSWSVKGFFVCFLLNYDEVNSFVAHYPPTTQLNYRAIKNFFIVKSMDEYRTSNNIFLEQSLISKRESIQFSIS